MAAEAVAEEGWEDETTMYEYESIQVTDISKSWYADLKHYLSTKNMPEDLDAYKRRALRLKSAKYQLISGILFRRNFDNVLLRCLEKDEALKALSSLHEGPTGGHFGAEVTDHKILKVGYYWPTLFIDAHTQVRKCEECQKSTGREKRLAFPIQPIEIENPF